MYCDAEKDSIPEMQNPICKTPRLCKVKEWTAPPKKAISA
jgi:hypothetical protein